MRLKCEKHSAQSLAHSRHWVNVRSSYEHERLVEIFSSWILKTPMRGPQEVWTWFPAALGQMHSWGWHSPILTAPAGALVGGAADTLNMSLTSDPGGITWAWGITLCCQLSREVRSQVGNTMKHLGQQKMTGMNGREWLEILVLPNLQMCVSWS